MSKLDLALNIEPTVSPLPISLNITNLDTGFIEVKTCTRMYPSIHPFHRDAAYV
jgi:hypothetical protein